MAIIPPFYLFGMGPRRKLLYRAGELLDAFTVEPLRAWPAVREVIEPAEYRVALETRAGKEVILQEDEEGVWLTEAGERVCLSAGQVRLPRFEGHPRAGLLRALHQEILVNLVDGRPVPNLWVYPRPWYRDAAMMLVCLEKTGNLPLVEEWVAGLREPFDRNNAGHCEPDNLGELLTMIALVSDRQHPLVQSVLDAAPSFKRGRHICGITDGNEHPVYQTKWLKYGLRALGLDDPYEIPAVPDSYSDLFWMDFRDQHVGDPPPGAPLAGSHDELRAAARYPYLDWAKAHFHRLPPPMPDFEGAYPLTWETRASEADYPRMALVSDELARRRTAVPHTWHAAEMFLYFAE